MTSTWPWQLGKAEWLTVDGEISGVAESSSCHVLSTARVVTGVNQPRLIQNQTSFMWNDEVDVGPNVNPLTVFQPEHLHATTDLPRLILYSAKLISSLYMYLKTAGVIGVARISCEEGHETIQENNFRVTHKNIMKFMQ